MIASQAAPALRAAERRNRAFKLRSSGATLNEIAAHLGISAAVVSRDIHRVILEASTAGVEEVRAVQCQNIATIRMALMPKVQRGDVQATDRILRLLDHEAKLFGIYSPVKAMVQVASDADFADTAARLLNIIGGSRELPVVVDEVPERNAV